MNKSLSVEQTQEKPQYWRIKEFDFNDVFDYSKYVYGTYEQVKQYLINQYKEEYRDKLDIEESAEDIFVMTYLPVTDENGNEVDENDPRYEELSEDQEVRLDVSFSAELTDKEDTEGETLIDLTSDEDQ